MSTGLAQLKVCVTGLLAMPGLTLCTPCPSGRAQWESQSHKVSEPAVTEGSSTLWPSAEPRLLLWIRVRVVFRRIHLVWVLVVIPATGSMLAALQILEQVTRICLAAVRGYEVTPEKLTKKFPEV